jgi:crotonobetainyl-CoA:carnitine CoA-transferase CaiB-like acyl-CoA transferase
LLRTVRTDIILVSIRRERGTLSSLDMDDIVAGTAAAGAACVALLHHRNTGKGQHVEVDAADCAVSLVGELVVARAMGQAAPAPVAVPLPPAQELLRDPYFRERRFLEPVSHSNGIVQEIAGPPWRSSLTPGHVRLPAPQPGQHNRYVFLDLLGLSPVETEDLQRRGIIEAMSDV